MKHPPLNIHSLRWKFFAITLLIALCVMALSLGLCYVLSVRTIERTTANYMNEYIRYADDSMNSMISSSLALSLAISMDRELVAATVSDPAAEASFPWYQKKKSLEGFLTAAISDKPYIRQAFVAVEDGRIYQSGAPLMLRRELEEAWFLEAAGQQAAQLHYEMKEEPRVLLTRPLPRQWGPAAVVMLELDYDALVAVYDITPLQSAQMLIYTPAGDLFHAGMEGGIPEEYHSLDFWPQVRGNTLSTGYQTLRGERCFVVQYRSEITGLSTVGILTERALIHDAMHLSGQVMGITIVCVLLAAVASIAFSFLLFRNLHRFVRSMKQVRGGKLHVRAEIRTRDEIGEMAETFNSMMNRIEGLMEQVKIEEAGKREAEQRVLEAQIQPHFLYNAISAIQYVASMRREADIEQAAGALSHLLRSVLGSRDEFITLWEEHEYIGSYMAIQRFKFQGAFSLQWEVEEGLWTLPIPKLLLQPIVENALIHGIALKEDGVISVRAYTQGDQVVLKVTDDGKGMDAGMVRRLTEGGEPPETQARTFRQVGVGNVFSRLRMIYGPTASYSITSEPGLFTCVELRFAREGEVG